MDKKDGHSCKHSQRDSFIDTRAASHCYAFHRFPHPDDSASRYMQPRCTALVNEALSAASDNVAMPRAPASVHAQADRALHLFPKERLQVGSPAGRALTENRTGAAVENSGVTTGRGVRTGNRGSKITGAVECALDGGQLASWELTGAAGLSEDESHGQAPHP
jgi:hypothetical protein